MMENIKIRQRKCHDSFSARTFLSIKKSHSLYCDKVKEIRFDENGINELSNLQ